MPFEVRSKVRNVEWVEMNSLYKNGALDILRYLLGNIYFILKKIE